MRSTLSHPSVASAGLIPLRILLPCSIVRADLASCGAVQSEQAGAGKTYGGLSSLTE